MAGCARSADEINTLQFGYPDNCDFSVVGLASDSQTGNWINALVARWGVPDLVVNEDLPPSIAAVPVNPGVINTAMLQYCFGSSADEAPTPEQWATSAVPFFLNLSAADNGRSISV